MKQLSKAVLTVSIILIATIIPKPTFAQGTFGCEWIGAQDACVVDTDDVNCEAGFISSQALCASAGASQSACNAAQPNCVSAAAPPSPTLPPPPVGGSCGGAPGSGGYIDTALGCIPYDSPESITTFFLRWGIGIGGGLVIILISIAGFQISTSSGDPRRKQAGQELLTSALAGLIMLIFSAFLLRIIGVDILGLF